MNLKAWLAARLVGWRGPLLLEFVEAVGKPGQSVATLTPLVASIYSRWHQ